MLKIIGSNVACAGCNVVYINVPKYLSRKILNFLK